MTRRWRLACWLPLRMRWSRVRSCRPALGVTASRVSLRSDGQCDQSGAWYDSAVPVTWNVDPLRRKPQGCVSDDVWRHQSTTLSVRCGGAQTARPPIQSISFPLNVEASNPTANAVAARAPDSNGWYNHPVAVSFAGGFSFSGFTACSPTTTYGGPDALSTTVSGSCTDNAGKTAGASIGLHYDATPPSMTAGTPSRPPDENGWYNHPVTFTFTGTDSRVRHRRLHEPHVQRPGQRADIGRSGAALTAPETSPRSPSRCATTPLPPPSLPPPRPGDGARRSELGREPDSRPGQLSQDRPHTGIPRRGGQRHAESRFWLLAGQQRAQPDSIRVRDHRHRRGRQRRGCERSSSRPDRTFWGPRTGRGSPLRRCCAGRRCVTRRTTTSSCTTAGRSSASGRRRPGSGSAAAGASADTFTD